jgi:sarcosine oxidase subunit alpha
MKRFTTHGMATDQARIGGLVGSAVLAEARGVPLASVGQSRPRPFATPVPFGALAGAEVREHYKPKRRLPLHEWHEAAGATFVPTGLWLRPLVYSRQSGWDPVLAEARAVRSAVGLTDVSTLGKIDVQGPDAGRFLDLMYANTFSTLAVGRARYGIMLREDGMLFDDGTTSRLAPDHYLVSTTTANAAAVLEHLEFHLQASQPHLDVVLTDVGDQWAQFAVAGPRARDVVAQVVAGVDLSNEGFPFMAAGAATIAGIAGRLFRISFSGELAYELAVPARHAYGAWSAVLEAGEEFGIRPYGLDALNTLRIEKGHVTTAELNGNTNAADLGFARLLKKEGDFIGRALAERGGMTAPDRLQLVGVRPLERGRRLRNGTQLVAAGAPNTSLGFITSSTPSVELEGWVGLALLAGGRRRIGSRLLGTAPIHAETLDLEVLSPYMLDPENRRVRA